jgi:hypothetical protein
MQKEDLRLLIGSSLQSAGLTEPFRRLYELLAKSYIWNTNSDVVQAAWVRRSLVTSDFIPICSDIDMTVLIDDKRLEEIYLSKKFLKLHPVKDVQFIGSSFLEAWMATGGFRNRQATNWKQIYGEPSNINPTSYNSKEEMAFELGHEVHLLYRQLHEKLKVWHICKSEQTSLSLFKLTKELERLRLFWSSQDPRWINIGRAHIPFSYSLSDYFITLDSFCAELLQSLRSPLNTFDWKEMITEENGFGTEINININLDRVFLVKDSNRFLEAFEKRPNNFVTSESYLELIKGIGVQEQTLLNKLASQRIPYYLQFNGQRLAHDLLGAILLTPDNHEQLYYCFANINSFCLEMTGASSPNWPEIQQSWQLTKQLPYSGRKLIKVILANLDQVSAIL